MSDLSIRGQDEALWMDSLEVAGIVGKRHDHLLRDIRSHIKIMAGLVEPRLCCEEFFKESTYLDSTGRRLPCYLISKKGFDYIVYEMTGKKGAALTAEHVNKVNDAKMKGTKTVDINELTLNPIEYSDQRVLLTAQLAEMYGTTEKVISNNYNNNKERYHKDIDFIRIENADLQRFLHSYNLGLQNMGKIRSLYLWTESGALLHAKSLGTDQAWDMYRKLMQCYFIVKSGTLPAAPQAKPALDKETRAKAMLMNAKRGLAQEYRKLYDAAGIKPEYQIMALQNFIGDDGPKLPAKALESTKVTYDKGTIAEKVGVYAQASGKPHAQAIGAIISVLDILPEEMEQVPYMRNGHDAFDTQFTASVIDKVKGWLEANEYPNPLNLNGKNYKVIYKEREK